MARNLSSVGILLAGFLAATASAQTPDTYDDPVSRAHSGLSKSEVLRAFERLAYGDSPLPDTPGRLTRWDQPEVGIYWTGTLGSNEIPAERPWYAELHAFIDELDNIEGVPRLLSFFDTDSLDIKVVLIASAEIEERVVRLTKEEQAWLAQDCWIFPGDPADDIEGPHVYIKYDLDTRQVRSCIVSTMLKSLGFVATEDVAELSGSAVDMTPSYPYLTNLDYYLVRILYDPRYAPSMRHGAGMAAVTRIVDDLMPN